MPPSSPSAAPTRVLILGGTSEATALAHALAGRQDMAVILSLAGRTRAPAAQPVETRIGGFGGIDGLATYLRSSGIDVLVDATHPFAAAMSANASEAAARAACPLIRVARAAWRPEPGDDWREVADMAAAAHALGPMPRRVFLTIGRLQLSAFAAHRHHHYVIRSIDPIGDGHGMTDATFIEARAPFDTDAEEGLMRDHGIDVLVTKNSGGSAVAGKLVAARRLGLPVILVRRPTIDDGCVSVEEAVEAVEAHRAATLRGV